jgi:hypothetical protein
LQLKNKFQRKDNESDDDYSVEYAIWEEGVINIAFKNIDLSHEEKSDRDNTITNMKDTNQMSNSEEGEDEEDEE